MFRNYLRTAIHILVKNRSFSIINITCLTLGIAASLMIMVYVINELSFDRFHKNRNEIYRAAVDFGSGESKMKFAGAMPALAPAIISSIPEDISAVRIRKEYDAVITDSAGKEFPEQNMFFSDPGFFDVFSFPLLEGNRKTILTEPYTMIVSEKIAQKYFGKRSPMGRTLYFQNMSMRIDGVMKDPPENTHLKCEIIASYSTLKSLGRMPEQPWNSWGEDLTYILLRKNTQAASIKDRLNKLLADNAGEWLAGKMKFDLQSINEIHWVTDIRSDIGPKGNRIYVYIFLSAAILVLVIACFNYLNLSASNYLDRLREVAVRKTFGAERRDIIAGFLTESFVIILVSGFLSYFIYEQFYAALFSYLGMNEVMNDSHFLLLVIIIFLMVVVTAVIAGVYPAVYISGFAPIGIFRRDPQGLPGKMTIRKILLILQFAISIILIAGTIVIYRQLDYVKTSDPGFDARNVILINFRATEDNLKKYEVFRDELSGYTGIESVSGAFTVPGLGSRMNISVQPDTSDRNKAVIMQALPADFGIVNTLGLKIKDGRDFSRNFMTDKSGSAILNESAVKALGMKNPIGARVIIPGDDHKDGVSIIGVIKDFHMRSFHEQINPMLIYINPISSIRIAVRLSPGDSHKAIGLVSETWSRVFPEVKFEYSYLDDTYYQLYNTEEKSGFLLLLFSLLAIFIAGLGLIGFSSLTTSKRIKEVGIRKILGGKSSGIMILLLRQYTIWIFISGIIAFPFSIIIANKWLQNFAFHTIIPWWTLPSAMSAVLIVTLISTGWQSIRAASKNPVETMRYE